MKCPKCGTDIEITPEDAAAALGKKGGSAKSERKTEAVRENAKKGGWKKGTPRKKKEE